VRPNKQKIILESNRVDGAAADFAAQPVGEYNPHAPAKLEAAQAAFDEYLAISRHLAEQDPSNAGWQRELAVAQRRIGDVLQARGKLEAAQAAFGEALAISRHLAEQDPSNADWQRELAVACWRIAHLEAKAGRHAAALPLSEEASRIFGVLAERAPGFAQWAKEKENVESELFLSKQGKRKENPD
jgi:tetratricopeptide (TPR) repeat protein